MTIGEPIAGVHHWTAVHPRIKSRVSSHFLAGSATLLDPLLPEEEGLQWSREHGPPQRIVLTNRHHLRHGEAFAEEFGCPILCNEAGMHEFAGGPGVEPFAV